MSIASDKALWLARVVAKTRTSLNSRKNLPVKHSKSGCGSKFRRAEEETELKLICFPEIDKRDSLVCFPYIFVKLMNSGDQKSLRKFMFSYLDKSCVISLFSFCGDQRWSCQQMLDAFVVMNEIHPDSVSCVHTTRLLENAIEAMVYYKYTDSATLSQSMVKTSKDPIVHRIAASCRGDELLKRMNLDGKSPQERQYITALAESDDDLTIYGKMTLRVTFDVYSKKVVRFESESDVISSVKRCTELNYNSLGSSGEMNELSTINFC